MITRKLCLICWFVWFKCGVVRCGTVQRNVDRLFIKTLVKLFRRVSNYSFSCVKIKRFLFTQPPTKTAHFDRPNNLWTHMLLKSSNVCHCASHTILAQCCKNRPTELLQHYELPWRFCAKFTSGSIMQHFLLHRRTLSCIKKLVKPTTIKIIISCYIASYKRQVVENICL